MSQKEIETIDIVGPVMLKSCTDDYSYAIWMLIRDDVVADIKECTDGEDGFTQGDLALAIGRVLTKRLGLEHWEINKEVKYERQ